MLNAFKLALLLLSLLLFYGLCDCLDIDTALEQRQRFRIDTRVSRSPDLPKYNLKNTIWNKKFRKNPKKFYQVVDKTYDDKYGFNTKQNFTTFLLETFQSASVKDVVKNKDVRVKYRELLENVRNNCGLRGLFTMLKCLRADAEDCKLDCEPKLEKREFDPEFEEFYRNLYGYGNGRGQKRKQGKEGDEDEGVSPNKKPRLDDQNNDDDFESDAYSDDGAETDDEFSEGSEEYETEDVDSGHMLSYFSSRGNSTDSQKGSKEREKPRRSSYSEEDDEDSYSEDYSSESDSGSDDEEEERPDERKTRSKDKQKESTKDTEQKRRREDFDEYDSEEEPEEDRFTDNRNRNRGDGREERRRRDSDEDEDLSDDETEEDRFRDNRNREGDRDPEERRKSDDAYLRRKEEDDGNELREVGGYGQNQPRNSFWGGILSFIGKLTMGIIIGLCIIIVMVGLGILFTLGAMLIVTIALIIHAAVRGRSKNEESVNAALTPNNLPPSANNPSLPNNAAPATSTDLVEQKEEAPRRPW